MGKEPSKTDSGEIEGVELKSALEERYLAYALSTIMHRALPDVRDGLKPVHRRLLFAMRLLKLDPGQGFKKCARVVGDVIGKFHPHGDQSVYEALVRLAQDFAQRYPLVDGQGNFGNIDGDSAAAMRYTEARLTDTASLLLDGINENAVDFRTTYDGEEEEPIVLPAAFPNLLANGSNGIAVGMATSIPPHNAGEVIAAARMVIANPDVTTRELMRVVPGPDFPTGGIIIEGEQAIHQAYETGRGGFRVRARWHKEEYGRGSYIIVITQIPYQVPKSRLVEKLAELIVERKLPFLEDVRDESTEDIRLVLEPKNRNVDADVLMESLFRLTELESRISLNMNVLSKGQVPMVLSLKEVLRQWLDHRRVVLVRRSDYRLTQINHRLEILAGYIIAFLNLDEVIRIIREEDEPKPILMARFALTDVQAEAILNMRLRSLRRLEEMELRREHEGLTLEREQILALLASEDKQWKTIDWELETLLKAYGADKPGCARRSTFEQARVLEGIDVREALIEREPVTVVLSEKGWIRALKGHVQDLSGLTFKTDDKLHHALLAQTTDTLLAFATNGKVFSIDPSKLPGGRGAGEPLRLLVDLEQGAEIIDVVLLKADQRFLMATREGRGFIIKVEDCLANTRKGKQVLNVDEPDVARFIVPVEGDMLAIVGDNRRLLLFALDSVPVMSRGKGVRLFKFREGGIADMRTFERAHGFGWTDSAGRKFMLDDMANYEGERGTVGRMVPRGFPKSNKFTG